MMRRICLLTLFLGVLVGTTSASATPGVKCGDTLTSDTTLETDLIGCPGDGLRVVGDVTLDLNGHTISGSGTGVGVWLGYGSSPGVMAVRGGTVRGFGTGIKYVGGCCPRSKATILGVNIRDNVGNGLLTASDSPNLVLRDSSVVGNGGVGVVLYAYSPLSELTRNRIAHNSGNGIELEYSSGASIINANQIIANGGDGIYTFDASSTTTHNFVYGNGGTGINFYENEGLTYGSSYFLASNQADHNGALGISACIRDANIPTEHFCLPGMRDGGGNTASGNGDPRQCVNIVCAPSRRS